MIKRKKENIEQLTLCFLVKECAFMEQHKFIDRRPVDTFLYNRLLEYGYAPSIEEVQDLTDIFFELFIELGVEVIEIDEDDMDDPRSF